MDPIFYYLTVAASMLFINLLIAYGMYMNAKKAGLAKGFDPQYIIYAVLGAFIGYNLYSKYITFNFSLFEIFMDAAVFAIMGESLIKKGADAVKVHYKANKELEENGS